MRLVCSRLARTLQELSDYHFEIRYTPGHLNSAADALSRIGSPAVDTDPNVETLPAGLMVAGSPTPGGGNSLFVSYTSY